MPQGSFPSTLVFAYKVQCLLQCWRHRHCETERNIAVSFAFFFSLYICVVRCMAELEPRATVKMDTDLFMVDCICM